MTLPIDKEEKVEPVAWRVKTHPGAKHWLLFDYEPKAIAEGEVVEPLYALPSAMTAHDWQPDCGVLRFESHPGGEAPHVHTTCANCGARAWFLEYQWELLAKGCQYVGVKE